MSFMNRSAIIRITFFTHFRHFRRENIGQKKPRRELGTVNWPLGKVYCPQTIRPVTQTTLCGALWV